MTSPLQSPLAPRADRERWILLGLMAVLVAAAWANGLAGEFTYDDKVEVVGNRTLRFLHNLGEIVGYNVSRPVVILSWALDWRLWGQNPVGYHVVNVLIHALNAILAFLLVEEILRRADAGDPRQRTRLAFAAAAAWALHPMTTEAVTYVTGRSESLCATFILGALIYWTRWRRAGEAFDLALSGACLLLGLATKEVAAVLPLLLLLLELGLPQPAEASSPGPSRRAVALALGAAWAVILGALLARRLIYGVFLTDAWIRPIGVQLLTEAEVVTRYLRLWLLPVGQSVFHDHPVSDGLFSLRTALSLLLLLSLAVAALLASLRLRRLEGEAVRIAAPLPFLFGFFLVSLLPSSSFVPLKETMAEHRAYLAGLAVCVSVVLLVQMARLRFRLPGLGMPLLLLLLATLGGLTHLRNRCWRTEVALWGDAVSKNPSSAEANYGHGDALRFAGQFDAAEKAYRRCVELDPDYLDAMNNLGIALAERGHHTEARETWRQALRRQPSYCKAHNNLGWLAYRMGRWDEALVEFRTTLSWCPDDVQANYGLGNVYFGPRRDVALATRHYEALLALDPEFVEAETVRKRLLSLTW
jgi:tetratricopeptide (TPR) repeat protein